LQFSVTFYCCSFVPFVHYSVFFLPDILFGWIFVPVTHYYLRCFTRLAHVWHSPHDVGLFAAFHTSLPHAATVAATTPHVSRSLVPTLTFPMYRIPHVPGPRLQFLIADIYERTFGDCFRHFTTWFWLKLFSYIKWCLFLGVLERNFPFAFCCCIYTRATWNSRRHFTTGYLHYFCRSGWPTLVLTPPHLTRLHGTFPTFGCSRIYYFHRGSFPYTGDDIGAITRFTTYLQLLYLFHR